MESRPGPPCWFGVSSLTHEGYAVGCDIIKSSVKCGYEVNQAKGA